MSKRKLAVLVVSFLVGFSTFPASGAAPAKPGSKCGKVGLAQIIAGKKYICIKAGNKLIWNKGVTLIAIPSKSAQPSATPAVDSSATPAASETTPSHTLLVKYKNCAEVKAAGFAPLTKNKTPELYDLNSGLDRDKDGIACEN